MDLSVARGRLRDGRGRGDQRSRGTHQHVLAASSWLLDVANRQPRRWFLELAVQGRSCLPSVVPMAYILVGVRRRRLTDRHVGVRQERPLPLLVGVASVVGVGLLIQVGAPRELIALEAAMAVGLGSSLLVTLAWMISIHAAVSAGSVVILLLVVGPGCARARARGSTGRMGPRRAARPYVGAGDRRRGIGRCARGERVRGPSWLNHPLAWRGVRGQRMVGWRPVANTKHPSGATRQRHGRGDSLRAAAGLCPVHAR
jgi:hypothetical protein